MHKPSFVVSVLAFAVVTNGALRSDFDFDDSSGSNALQVDLSEIDRAGLSEASDQERAVTMKELGGVVSKILASSTGLLSREKDADSAAKAVLDRHTAKMERQRNVFEQRKNEHSSASKLFDDTAKALVELQAALKVIQESQSNEEIYRSAEGLVLQAQETFAHKLKALLRVTEKISAQDADKFAEGYAASATDPLGAVSDVQLASTTPLKSADDVWPMVSALDQRIKGSIHQLNMQSHTSQQKLLKIKSLIKSTEARTGALKMDLQRQSSLMAHAQKSLAAAEGLATEAGRLYRVTHAAYSRRAQLVRKQIQAMEHLQNLTSIQML